MKTSDNSNNPFAPQTGYERESYLKLRKKKLKNTKEEITLQKKKLKNTKEEITLQKKKVKKHKRRNHITKEKS